MSRKSLFATCLAGTMLLASCSDEPTVPLQGDRTAAAQPARPPQSLRAGERAFRGLARDVPEFAGFYLNERGELVVRITDPGRGAAMRAALLPFLKQLAAERGNPGARMPKFVFEKADYSFVQLSEWRDRLEPVFSLDGVILMDLDERTGRVTVGLADEGARAGAEARVRDLGVPLEAVDITVTGVPRPQAARGTAAFATSAFGCTHLQSFCRPLMGGAQITYFRDGDQHLCSIGFPVLFNGGELGFVTAAHCSDDEWNRDNTVYYQASYPNYQVGTEAIDPNGWGSFSGCEFMYVCRDSDANVVRASVETDVGYVARTTGVENGSLSVSSATPRFAISSSSDAYGGETVYAMGRTSGWLRGTVLKTCTDFKKTWEGRWHKVLCSDVADYNVQGGDSGGPVFLWNGTSDRITLIGINFARTEIYDHSFFSPVNGIRNDLGSMEVRAPEFRTSGGTGGGGGGGGDCGGETTPNPTFIIEPC
jgi:hypothetical protein